MTLHIHNPALLPKVRSRALLDAVEGMPCGLRVASIIPGRRCSDPTTVVPCHMDGTIGKGMGTKVSDLSVSAGCHACHNIISGVDRAAADYLSKNYPAAVLERMLKGMCETQSRWVGMGLIEVKGGEVVK
jgi:hypothetical protein